MLIEPLVSQARRIVYQTSCFEELNDCIGEYFAFMLKFIVHINN